MLSQNKIYFFIQRTTVKSSFKRELLQPLALGLCFLAFVSSNENFVTPTGLSNCRTTLFIVYRGKMIYIRVTNCVGVFEKNIKLTNIKNYILC